MSASAAPSSSTTEAAGSAPAPARSSYSPPARRTPAARRHPTATPTAPCTPEALPAHRGHPTASRTSATPLLDDPELAAALRTAHTELSACPDPLEAESRLPWLLTALARRHSTARPVCDRSRERTTSPTPVRDRLADELQRPALPRRPRRRPRPVPLPAPARLPYDDGDAAVRLARPAPGEPGPRACWRPGGARPRWRALVGFADQAHLTRWFRRVLGVTPAAYRNSVQDTRR